uniref:Uncharacterized protein n=1 Tax=Scleropages formosus TaxID=113540 RepID=A0A8C9QWB4_SCLFO
APLPIGGGGPPLPGGYCVGAAAMLAPAAAAATVPLPCGVITWKREQTKGPPTPRTGPARPAGAWGIGAPAGTPLPAARPTPGPPATPTRGTRTQPRELTSFGGGPSTVIDTRFSPLTSTRPSTRFSSRSGCFDVECHHATYLIFLNSSQSQRMRFICLSKALKVPMKMRPSCRIQRIL